MFHNIDIKHIEGALGLKTCTKIPGTCGEAPGARCLAGVQYIVKEILSPESETG